MVKITYWADLECPFCYIGVNRMERVIREMGVQDKVIMQIKAFEVMPENGPEPIQTFAEHCMEWGHNKSFEQAKEWIDHTIELAEEENLVCKLHTVKLTNTRESHRMIKYAQTCYDNDTANRLLHRIWDGYFDENKGFCDKEMLLKACTDAGMDPAESWEVINSDRFKDMVIQEEEAATALHVAEVPAFFFGTDFVLMGAQQEEMMRKCVEVALREDALRQQVSM